MADGNLKAMAVTLLAEIIDQLAILVHVMSRKENCIICLVAEREI